ncbi:11535_t:CDS:2 [Funneliformis caledonium]|uniref:11535_t:CDS:1 n=1 Tax=Funneliformis caledonium TaxID=1117310 RepID=A0A9N9I905_9GLOM|nr:11535_t:CDS:2 [Funneliformis caledonium]
MRRNQKEDLSENDHYLRLIFDDCNDLIGKVKSALYIVMKHYWNVSQDKGMIAAILDPRCKFLSFASESQIIRTKNLLREIMKKPRKI